VKAVNIADYKLSPQDKHILCINWPKLIKI
jgi:hypothetical protein